MAYIPHGTIITTEANESLTGVFGTSSAAEIFPAGPGMTARIPFVTENVPILNIPWNIAHEQKGIANESGASFVELELAAHTQSAMHSTQSVDLGVVLTGEIVLVLDSGEGRVLKPGDLIVQKGATHRWENRTESPARLITVVIAARGPVTEK